MISKFKALAAIAVLAFTTGCWSQQPQQDTSFNSTGLTRTVVDSINCFGFWNTPSFHCDPLKLDAYFMPAANGQHRALVVISHGSGGIDKRHSDYARYLSSLNIDSVVLDHWSGRGVSKIHLDFNAARGKGASGFNMAIDVLAATSQFKQRAEWKDARLGYIGESIGGSSAISVTRPVVETIVADNTNRPVHNIDAVVALYPGCTERNVIERFKPIPLLLLTGSKDDNTPAASCERQVEWMNKRGAQAEFQQVPDQHHDFDAPYRLMYSPRAENPSKCENVRQDDVFVMQSNGQKFPATAEGMNMLRNECNTRGTWGGNQGNPKTGYDIWGKFFTKNLL